MLCVLDYFGALGVRLLRSTYSNVEKSGFTYLSNGWKGIFAAICVDSAIFNLTVSQ